MADVTQPASASEPRLSPEPRPVVSIIVPARNEEACLTTCLSSLVAQSGPATEIIVVDDHSTDRTAEIAISFAAAHASLRVISPPPLPEGWIGKSNAVVAGAALARGQWLLFTDADTFHQPGSLARALDEAARSQAAMLSYSPEQEVHGFWEMAVMPVVFAELAATFRPSDVSNPASPVVAANGQYLLIRSDVYQAVGGHAAVAHDLLEDVALARHVKQAGHRLLFRYAPDAVRTRMYRSFAQLCEGWTKNLVLLFPNPRRLILKRLAEFYAIAGSLLCAALCASLGWWDIAPAFLAISAISYATFLRRILRAHFPWRANLLAIFGLSVFVHLLRRSAIQWNGDGVTWKGRRYGRSTPGDS